MSDNDAPTPEADTPSISSFVLPIPESPMLTAALTLANSFCLIVLEAMKGQTMEQRNVQWQRWIDFWEPWHAFWFPKK